MAWPMSDFLSRLTAGFAATRPAVSAAFQSLGDEALQATVRSLHHDLEADGALGLGLLFSSGRLPAELRAEPLDPCEQARGLERLRDFSSSSFSDPLVAASKETVH